MCRLVPHGIEKHLVDLGSIHYASIMRVSFRKILIGMICVSLAIANGFTPRHAMAKGNPAATQHAQGSHDHAHHHGTAIDDQDHDHGLVDKSDNVSKGNVSKSDDAGAVPGESKGLTDNCCVASCSAIALIFATVELSPVLPMKAFVSSRQNSLVLAARTTDDPPPR